VPSEASILKNLAINEEDEGCLSPPQLIQKPHSMKSTKNKVFVVVGCGDSKMPEAAKTSGKLKEKEPSKSSSKVKADRVRKSCRENYKLFGDKKDLLQLEARVLLAKKLNELANDRLDIWEKRQKFVRQKSFDLESDVESEGDAIIK